MRFHVIEQTAHGAERIATFTGRETALSTAATLTAPTDVGVTLFVVDDNGNRVEPTPKGQRKRPQNDDTPQPGLWSPETLAGQEAIPVPVSAVACRNRPTVTVVVEDQADEPASQCPGQSTLF